MECAPLKFSYLRNYKFARPRVTNTFFTALRPFDARSRAHNIRDRQHFQTSHISRFLFAGPFISRFAEVSRYSARSRRAF